MMDISTVPCNCCPVKWKEQPKARTTILEQKKTILGQTDTEIMIHNNNNNNEDYLYSAKEPNKRHSWGKLIDTQYM